MENIFKIGDRVRIKDYEDLPEDFKNRNTAKTCGKEGVIEDILWSSARQANVIKIRYDSTGEVSHTNFPEGSFDILPPIPEVTYGIEFDYADNVVIAIFYEYCGDDQRELARAHGHIIHEGAIGVAQAASFATKRCYDKVSGNDKSKSYYFNK